MLPEMTIHRRLVPVGALGVWSASALLSALSTRLGDRGSNTGAPAGS
jgi:hypothetical protein